MSPWWRPGDEKLQLSAFLLTQHRNLSSTNRHSESEVWGFFNSHRGTAFPSDGQLERMNRMIKDATVKRFHYDDPNQLLTHLADFVVAYNFARRLKNLGGLDPCYCCSGLADLT